jgi:hypothetical protein
MLKLSKLQRFILLNSTKRFTKLSTSNARCLKLALLMRIAIVGIGYVGTFDFAFIISSEKDRVVTRGAGLDHSKRPVLHRTGTNSNCGNSGKKTATSEIVAFYCKV